MTEGNMASAFFPPDVVAELNARRTEMLIVVSALWRVVASYQKGRVTYNRYLLVEDAAHRARVRYMDYLHELADVLPPELQRRFVEAEAHLRQGLVL